MKKEFVRLGIPQYRNLTGILQLAGGTGVLVGMLFSSILAFTALAGLAILMFMGFWVRLKTKDGFRASAPALIFAILNLILAVKFYLILLSEKSY
jgi:hypothetical protein